MSNVYCGDKLGGGIGKPYTRLCGNCSQATNDPDSGNMYARPEGCGDLLEREPTSDNESRSGVISIEIRRGNETAHLYGQPDDLSLGATHRFAGALMPALRQARARGELTRAQYKRAKDTIELRMQENMQYDRDRSYPYGKVTKADVRAEIRSICA